MTRILGAALVMLGSASLGVRAYLSLGAQTRSLAGFISMLAQLRREIERCATLEAALTAARAVEPSRSFVESVLRGIERRGGAEVGECWLDASAELSAPLGGVISELAPILGRYSAAEQGSAIAAAERKLTVLLEQTEQRRRGSGKTYVTFGVCGGIAAAILFF